MLTFIVHACARALKDVLESVQMLQCREGSTLHDGSFFEKVQGVSRRHNGRAVREHNDTLRLLQPAAPQCISKKRCYTLINLMWCLFSPHLISKLMRESSFSQSRLEEGSSRMRMSGSRSRALHRATRCLCPPERRHPPSPT